MSEFDLTDEKEPFALPSNLRPPYRKPLRHKKAAQIPPIRMQLLLMAAAVPTVCDFPVEPMLLHSPFQDDIRARSLR